MSRLLMLLCVLSVETTSAEIEIPVPLKSYYDSADVAFGLLPPSDGVGLQFVEFVKENWKVIARDLDSFAPGPRRQALVVAAAEFLPPREYIQFADSVCDLVAANRLSPNVIQSFLLAHQQKSGFFAVNYDAPEVRVLVAKFRQLVPPAKADLQSLLDNIDSGKAKKTFLMWQKAENTPDPELLGAEVSPTQGSANAIATPAASKLGQSPIATPLYLPVSPLAQTTAAPVKRPPAWIWVVGIAALMVVILSFLKLRSN